MNLELSEALELVLKQRYSCRGFLPDPISRAVQERIFNLGQYTPSWCNTQPWNVVVCEGAAASAFAVALSEHAMGSVPEPDLPMPERYEGVHRDRRREAGWALYNAVGVSRGDREAGLRQAMRNFEFFGAPVVAVISAPRNLGVYGAIDCGLYVQTILLAASSLGVSTIAQASLASYSPFVRQYLGIADDRMIVCGISFGYQDPDHAANTFRTTRESVDTAVTWQSAVLDDQARFVVEQDSSSHG